jgi:protein-tyrosine phosphatase
LGQIITCREDGTQARQEAKTKPGKKPLIGTLFVCTGNICRSPTAEGVFRHLVAQAGLQDNFRIDSAGTTASHRGEPPDDRARRVASSRGVSLKGLKARAITAADFKDFDYIYAMDSGHFDHLTAMAPGDASAVIVMFIDGQDVPDPWYGAEKDFEDVFALIEKGAANVLAALRREHDL